MKNFPYRSGNPSLLGLLNMGAKIEFQNGIWFKGDPENGYIDFGNDEFGSMGLYILNREGLRKLLSDNYVLEYAHGVS